MIECGNLIMIVLGHSIKKRVDFLVAYKERGKKYFVVLDRFTRQWKFYDIMTIELGELGEVMETVPVLRASQHLHQDVPHTLTQRTSPLQILKYNLDYIRFNNSRKYKHKNPQWLL